MSNRFMLNLICLVAIPHAGLDASESREKEKPNVIFLLTDDQASISMGCYGNPVVKTPNLDRLAKNGIVFDRHYVTTAICMASRANILTGLYEFRTGCNFTTGNMQQAQWNASYPMLFRKSGYRTAFAGKIGIEVDGYGDDNQKPGLPEADFDHWGAGPDQTFYATAKNPSMAKYATDYPHSTLSYAAFSRDFIRQSVADKKPFCLSISFKAAHRPVTPDPKFNGVYRDTIFPKPANFGREKGEHLAAQSKSGRQYPRFESWGYADDYNNVMKKYNQQVYAVDVAVGEIRKELAELNIEKNTIIIFTSDNGFMCGSHGYGSKVIPYEESTCVPLIVFDPTRPNAHGKRCDALTGSIDLCPTLLELAGLTKPENIDGVSLVPLLEDPELTNPESEVRKSLAIMNFWGPESTHSFGVVTRNWKYLYWYSQENNMVATEELFNLNADRMESVNFATDDAHLDSLNSMRELYESHLYEINDNAINETYRKYKDLFDRKQTWESKSAILNQK